MPAYLQQIAPLILVVYLCLIYSALHSIPDTFFSKGRYQTLSLFLLLHAGGLDTNLAIYKLGKALEAAVRTMERRAKQLTKVDKYILTHLSQESATTWGKSMLQ